MKSQHRADLLAASNALALTVASIAQRRAVVERIAEDVDIDADPYCMAHAARAMLRLEMAQDLLDEASCDVDAMSGRIAELMPRELTDAEQVEEAANRG